MGLAPGHALCVARFSPTRAPSICFRARRCAAAQRAGISAGDAAPRADPDGYPLELRPASLSPVWLQAKLRLLPNMHWVLVLGGKQQGSSPTLRLSALPRSKAVPNQTLRRAVYAVVDAPASSRLTLTVAGAELRRSGGPGRRHPVSRGTSRRGFCA